MALKDPAASTPTNLSKDNRNIFERLNAVMQAVTFVQKQKPQGLRYSIVSHDVVTAKVRPALVAQGIIYLVRDLVVVQNGNRTESRFTVRFQNVHNKDDFVDVPTIGYGIDDQDKGPGKALSYGVKTALLKTLGLEAGDGEDPDFDQETTHVSEEALKEERAFELALDSATDGEALDKLLGDVRKAYKDGKIDKATGVSWSGQITKKAAELKAKAKEENVDPK